MRDNVIVALVMIFALASLGIGYGGAAVLGVGTTTTTETRTQTATTSAVPTVVSLDIIADWGGPGYDAFIVPTSINSTVPKPVSASQPGPNNANITVPAGVPITFVISNLDTMNFTFNSKVTVPFTVFNNTENGYVALHYSTGQSANLIASHTFTITELNLNIPTPPDTVVTFTYTFANPGVYRYFCLTPCGPGMAVVGYMIGYIIAK